MQRRSVIHTGGSMQAIPARAPTLWRRMRRLPREYSFD